MSARRNNSPSPLINLIVWLVGICLIALPRSVVAPVRSLVWDIAAPGQSLLLSVTTDVQTRFFAMIAVPSSSSDESRMLKELQRRNRELETQNALLRDQVAHQPQNVELLPKIEGTSALLVPEMTTARILGAEQSRLWNEQPILGYGKLQGAKPELLVLDRHRPNVDVGSRQNISPDSPVYAGRIVVGRIANVGLWTSSLRVVTDAAYHGKARIYHPAPKSSKARGNWSAGAVGILEGNGKEGCRLKDISASAAVEVGDQVFTAEEDGILTAPMYYGEVTRADLRKGELNWTIEIRPALDLHRVQDLHVLKTRINPARLQESSSATEIQRVSAEEFFPASKEETEPDVEAVTPDDAVTRDDNVKG